jgi:hypothetical protein
MAPQTSNYLSFSSSTSSYTIATDTITNNPTVGDILTTYYTVNDDAPTGYPLGNPTTVIQLVPGSTVELAAGSTVAITGSVDVTGSTVNVEGTIDVGNNINLNGPVTIQEIIDTTVVSVPNAVAGTASSSNPTFAIRDVSCYSYGQYSGGTITNFGLIGAPITGYNNTELHEVLINNSDETDRVQINLQTAGGVTLLQTIMQPGGIVSYDFHGVRVGNQGVDLTSNGNAMVTFCYTWILT